MTVLNNITFGDEWVDIEPESFERQGASMEQDSDSGDTVVLENEDGDGYTIHGVAIGEGDETRGQSGIRKVWPKDTLKPEGDGLTGLPLVKDHENNSDNTIGTVTKSKYIDELGVVYEAELYDDSLATKIKNGLLEVSIRGFHEPVEEMEENDNGSKIVNHLKFGNLSIVPQGAAPSNTLNIGPSEHLQSANLAGYFSTEESPEDDEEDDDLARSEGAEKDFNENDLDEYDENYPEDGQERIDRQNYNEYIRKERQRRKRHFDRIKSGADELIEYSGAELANVTIHDVSYDGTSTSEWSKPSLSDFTDGEWGDLSEDEKKSIGGHFFVSTSGFPADSFGDMGLPVVGPSGSLSKSGLDSAWKMAKSTDALSDDQASKVKSKSAQLLESKFDVTKNSDEEENSESDEENDESEEDEDEDDEPVGQSLDIRVPGDNLQVHAPDSFVDL